MVQNKIKLFSSKYKRFESLTLKFLSLSIIKQTSLKNAIRDVLSTNALTSEPPETPKTVPSLTDLKYLIFLMDVQNQK